MTDQQENRRSSSQSNGCYMNGGFDAPEMPQKDHLPSLSFTSASSEFGLSKANGGHLPDNASTYVKTDDGYFEKAKGLGWVVTGLFVVGDLAGGGLVALPTAMIQSGFYTGVVLTILMTFIVGYTAHVLGKSWVILQRRWPTYRMGHCRNPYPEIGQRAVGPKMKVFVSACIDFSQFGISVVYLLLSSKNIHDFLKSFFDTNISFCAIILVVAVGLLPVTFLKSPQDFWGAVIMAFFTTSIAVILILTGAIIDYPKCGPVHEMPEFRLSNYFLALGTFLFAYGGHSAFPTIQHDMRKPHDFTKSSILAFGIIFALYSPVCLLGYMTYGNSLRESIINSIQTNWIQTSVNMLITVHCILTLTIVLNPINQEAENIFKVPQHFCLKRVVVRVGMLCAVVFVAESLPTFGPLLDVVGGSTMTLTSLIFPCIFYLFLNAAEQKALSRTGDGIPAHLMQITVNGEAKQLPGKPSISGASIAPEGESPATLQDVFDQTDKFTLFFCTFVIAFGIIGGGAATFSAVRELTYAHFVPPCYVSYFSSMSDPNEGGHMNCCGPYQNISVFGDGSKCAAPKLDFYD